MATAPAYYFDPSLYPRTYCASVGTRVVYCLLGGLVSACGLAGVVYLGTGHGTGFGATTLAAVCVALAGVGAAMMLYVLKVKVVLRPDAIEWRSPFYVRRLRRDDIAGWRFVQRARDVSVLVLVPRRAGTKKLKIPKIMETDALFDAWQRSLPDLDAQDLAQSTAEIMASGDLGRTPEERARRLANARTRAARLTGASIAVCTWSIAYPKPYEVVIVVLAALPVLALWLGGKSGRLYQFAGRRNDARASLALVLMLPALVLAIRAMLDFKILDASAAAAATAGTALVLALIVVVLNRETVSRWPAGLLVLAMCVFYAYGAMVEANVLLDRSAPQIFQTAVIGKRVSHGKTTRYHLHLAPWGPQHQDDDITVSHAFYASTAMGQRVCVVLHAGALHIRWFAVGSCTPADAAGPGTR